MSRAKIGFSSTCFEVCKPPFMINPSVIRKVRFEIKMKTSAYQVQHTSQKIRYLFKTIVNVLCLALLFVRVSINHFHIK